MQSLGGPPHHVIVILRDNEGYVRVLLFRLYCYSRVGGLLMHSGECWLQFQDFIVGGWG